MTINCVFYNFGIKDLLITLTTSCPLEHIEPFVVPNGLKKTILRANCGRIGISSVWVESAFLLAKSTLLSWIFSSFCVVDVIEMFFILDYNLHNANVIMNIA